jgi:uncharacterized protein YcnI
VFKRLAGATFVASLLVCAVAPAAFAHVSVSPSEAAQGGFTKIAFSVPNERDNASTTKVEVTFPTDHPVPFVSVKPHAGWTYAVDKTKLAKPVSAEGTDISEVVSKITWTAASAATAIKPGEFDEFEASLGPLPSDTDTLVFKALQTYDDGDIVRWIEETPAGGAEPEHPAPELTLTKASSSSDHHATGTSASTASSDTGKTLAIIALVVGALGLLVAVVAVVAVVRGRARAPSLG